MVYLQIYKNLQDFSGEERWCSNRVRGASVRKKDKQVFFFLKKVSKQNAPSTRARVESDVAVFISRKKSNFVASAVPSASIQANSVRWLRERKRERKVVTGIDFGSLFDY